MHDRLTVSNVCALTSLVLPGGFRHSFPFSGELIFDIVGFHVLDVDGADEHVVGNVVEMTAILQPRTRHRNVVSRAFAVDLRVKEIAEIVYVYGTYGTMLKNRFCQLIAPDIHIKVIKQ